MDSEAIQKYCDLMSEIKLRTLVVYAFIDGRLHAGYPATSIEMVYLQFRKILELIALGSLVANKEIFSITYHNFSKCWNAELMMKDIERINPDFYPKPIIQKKTGDKTWEWLERPNDYLTKDDLIKLYGKCGAIMHSGNPYGSQIDLKYYEGVMEHWGSRIMNLLGAHYICLVNDPRLYLIQMGSKDQPPTHRVFAPISTLKH